MIGALIGAAVALGSAVYGGIKSANAARKQKELIAGQEAKNSAWYERNYYQDYLNSSMAKSAMRRVEDTLDRKNRENKAEAAVVGATSEAVEAGREGNEKVLSDTVGQLAARNDARKDNIDAINLQNQNNISQQRMGQEAADEQGGAAFQEAGINALGSLASSAADGGTNRNSSGAAEYAKVSPEVKARTRVLTDSFHDKLASRFTGTSSLR